jgi:hypothetical protein
MNPLNRTLIIAFVFISLPVFVYSQATCASAVNLIPGITCSSGTSMNGTGDLKNAASALPAPACGTGNAYSNWFKFTALSPKITVTLNNVGNGINSNPYVPYVEVLSGTCAGGFTSLGCQQATGGSPSATLTVNGLTTNTVYYVRVYNTTQKTSGNCGF